MLVAARSARACRPCGRAADAVELVDEVDEEEQRQEGQRRRRSPTTRCRGRAGGAPSSCGAAAPCRPPAPARQRSTVAWSRHTSSASAEREGAAVQRPAAPCPCRSRPRGDPGLRQVDQVVVDDEGRAGRTAGSSCWRGAGWWPTGPTPSSSRLAAPSSRPRRQASSPWWRRRRLAQQVEGAHRRRRQRVGRARPRVAGQHAVVLEAGQRLLAAARVDVGALAAFEHQVRGRRPRSPDGRCAPRSPTRRRRAAAG